MRDFLTRTLSWETLKPEYLQMYTEPELRQLVAFYHTELGRKTLSTMPAIMRRGDQPEAAPGAHAGADAAHHGTDDAQVSA